MTPSLAVGIDGQGWLALKSHYPFTRLNVRSSAVFAQADYEVLRNIDLTVGGRINYDEKKYDTHPARLASLQLSAAKIKRLLASSGRWGQVPRHCRHSDGRLTDQALSILPREAKGPFAPPPILGGPAQAVADAIAAWPQVEDTTHWHLNDQTRVDGIDFYVGPDELGHIHLDGSIHLATTLELGAEIVAEGLG